MAAQQRELFRRFKVEKFLGKGSYGSVYRVQRLDDGKQYAVKETDVAKMQVSERQDAANEIRLLASIKHVNVCRYYEAFLDSNWLCIIMEHASRGDLGMYIRKGKENKKPFPEHVVWNYLIQVLRGLEMLHAQKIVHRDIKPQNIFIAEGDVVKIGDLGIAKILKNNVAANTQIGTPYYMAPEIWQRLPYTFGADVFSTGCMLYEMLTYKLPFDGKTMEDIQAKHRQKTPSITGNYSSAIKELCVMMMERDPSKRPTVAQLLKLPAVIENSKNLPEVCKKAAPVLGTIVVPRNIKQLQDLLPEASYDSPAEVIAAGRT